MNLLINRPVLKAQLTRLSLRRFFNKKKSDNNNTTFSNHHSAFDERSPLKRFDRNKSTARFFCIALFSHNENIAQRRGENNSRTGGAPEGVATGPPARPPKRGPTKAHRDKRQRPFAIVRGRQRARLTSNTTSLVKSVTPVNRDLYGLEMLAGDCLALIYIYTYIYFILVSHCDYRTVYSHLNLH